MKINGARGWMLFFSTHPPLEQRIAALQNAR
jgi:Zn-dependent protease with chaperone function